MYKARKLTEANKANGKDSRGYLKIPKTLQKSKNAVTGTQNNNNLG